MEKISDIMTREEIEAQDEKDTEFECTYYMDEKHNYKEEYLPEGESVENYTIDYAATQIRYGERVLSSAYTWYGIKKMDCWYFKQIRLEDCKYSKDELADAIKTNPHLHNIIKTNLLSNLYHTK